MTRARTVVSLTTVLAVLACKEQATSPFSTDVSEEASSETFSAGEAASALNLGTLGGLVGRAVAINDAGEVTGWSTVPGERTMAFRWAPGGDMVELPTLGGIFGQAVAINAHGQIAGRATNPGEQLRAVIWNGTVPTELGTLPGYASQRVRGQNLNDRGEVVGHSQDGAGGWHPFHWSSEGGIQALPQLAGNTGDAIALNENGQIVGWSTVAGGKRRAVLWTVGASLTITDLGTFGGDSSTAAAINEAGRVVGTARLSSGESRAFLWQSGTMYDLGTLGGSFSEAVGINDGGQIAGSAANEAGQLRAFLWHEGTMHDLGTLGGASSRASAVNGAGHVVGWSETASGRTHAFVWQAGTMTDLGTLGGDSSMALAINDSYQAAGWSKDGSGFSPAAVWELPEVAALPATPAEALAALTTAVNDLRAAGKLNKGQETALLAKLEQVQRQLDKGNVKGAVNVLGAFINQVRDLINEGVLSAADGEPLIELAQHAIGLLEG